MPEPKNDLGYGDVDARPDIDGSEPSNGVTETDNDPAKSGSRDGKMDDVPRRAVDTALWQRRRWRDAPLRAGLA